MHQGVVKGVSCVAIFQVFPDTQSRYRVRCCSDWLWNPWGERMELICPSCEARYSIPDGSIGEKGRQVSCMNCHHGWHAYPPLVLGAAQAAVTPAAGMQWRDPSAGNETPAVAPDDASNWSGATASEALPAVGSGFAAAQSSQPADRAERMATTRSEQLAEIRETLAEIQSEERAAGGATATGLDDAPLNDFRAPQPDPDETARFEAERTQVYPEAADPIEDPYDAAEEDNGVDELRSRLGKAEERAAAKSAARPTNLRKLRKKHDRRARRVKGDAAGSGAFLTGFLLVAIIASVMISLYLLHPQIIERVPAAERPLTEYVATIDGLRVSVAETYQGITGWVSEKLEGKV